MSVTSNPSKYSRTNASASASLRSGAKRKLTSTTHSSGSTLVATPPRMRGRVETLVVLQPVDHRAARLVVGQPLQDRGREVDRVDAAPGPRGVRPLPRQPDVDVQRALAAGLDHGVGGLHQDREVGGEQRGVALAELEQPVVVGLDLLAVVEHEGEVADRLGHRGGQPQDHRVAALHVAGAQAVQDPVVVEPRGQVVVDRHRVEVAGDHHPLVAAQLGAGHHGVAVPADAQVPERPQRRLDGVRDRLLVVADRLEVHQLPGQRQHVGGEVEGGAAGSAVPVEGLTVMGGSQPAVGRRGGFVARSARTSTTAGRLALAGG